MDSSAAWIATEAGRAWIVVAGASGSSGASRQSIETQRKSRWIPAAFSFLLAVPIDGNTSPVCWTSGGRFAKRRPLARLSGPVPGA